VFCILYGISDTLEVKQIEGRIGMVDGHKHCTFLLCQLRKRCCEKCFCAKCHPSVNNSKKIIENPDRTFNIFRFEVLMVAGMMTAVFWVVMLYSLVEVY
jgi:hypothetical protein